MTTSPHLAITNDDDLGILWPSSKPFRFANSGSQNLLNLSTAASRAMMFGRAVWRDSAIASQDLVAVHVRFNTVAAFPALGRVRFRTSGVDLTVAAWRSDEVHAQEHLGVAGVGPASSAVTRFAFDVPRTLARRELFCLDLDWHTFDGAPTLQLAGIPEPTQTLLTSAGKGHTHRTTTTTNGVAFSESTLRPMVVLEFVDGSFGMFEEGFPISAFISYNYSLNTIGGTALGGSRGNRKGGRLTVPTRITAVGVVCPIGMSFVAGTGLSLTDIEVAIYQGETEVARTEAALPNVSAQAFSGMLNLSFLEPVTLDPGEYVVVVEPLSGSPITLSTIRIADAAVLSDAGFGALMPAVSRAAGDLDWTPIDDTEYFWGALRVSEFYAMVEDPEPEPEPELPPQSELRWDDILQRIDALVRADATLGAVYGDAFRLMGSGEHRVPMLEWTFIGETEREIDNPMTIQFDQWVNEGDDLVASERRLRQLFHRELPFDFDGLTCWSQYVDGELLASPDRDNYVGRAIRFRITPLRPRYALANPAGS